MIYVGISVVLGILLMGLAFMMIHIKNTISKEFKYHFEAFKFKINKEGDIIPLLQYDFSKSGIPIIEVKINKNSYKFMLDSGANVNILDKRVFDTLENIETSESSGLTTANGDITGNNIKAKIQFKQKQKKFIEDFEIFDMSGPFDSIESRDGVKINGILGSNFFKTHCWTIDFENLVVWIK